MGEIFSLYQSEHLPIRGAYELFDATEVEAEAVRLIQIREQMPRVEVYKQERQDCARTALMEALTASGHLSRIEIAGSLEDINRQVLARLLNGYMDTLPMHEKQRRFAELCNELVIQRLHGAMAAGEVNEGTAVAEISDYFVGESDKTAQSLGYRPQNKKGMVRSTHLRRNEDGSFTRIIEQVSRSNGTAQTTLGLLHGSGIYPTGQGSPDVLALKTPLLYDTNDIADGVVTIQRKLDSIAGQGVRYGEAGNSQHVAYDLLRQESARREGQIEVYINKLAAYESKLEDAERKGYISADQRLDKYKEEVRQILRAICTLAPDYAKDCFGEQAAPYYQQAAYLEARGDHLGAMDILEQAKSREQAITLCGVGISPEEAKKLGLTVDSVSSLVAEGKSNWKWKAGVCQVKKCPSPKPTEVGPCSVCRNCQKLFDLGRDPTKIRPLARAAIRKSRQLSLASAQKQAA